MCANRASGREQVLGPRWRAKADVGITPKKLIQLRDSRFPYVPVWHIGIFYTLLVNVVACRYAVIVRE